MKQLVYTVLIGVWSLSATETAILIGPKTNLQKALITRLNKAQRRIWVASYLLTCAPLVHRLCTAHQRGCDVQVLVDSSQMNYVRGRQVVAQLRKKGITCIIYAAPHQGHLMHHKYAVIDENVWSGSMNWTTAGSTRNHESVIWSQQPSITRSFGAHFATLKRRAARIKVTTHTNNNIFFIPDHRAALKKRLLHALHNARKHIVISMYDLQEKTVIQALIDARQRGVPITIVTDQSTPAIPKLSATSLTHFHHKYAVIDTTVFLGSMNWTQRGMTHNQEAVMVFEQPNLCLTLQEYTAQLLRANGQPDHAVHEKKESPPCQENRS